MLLCDTLKIKADLSCFLKEKETFNKQYNPKEGTLKGIFYSSKDNKAIPFNLFIAIDYQRKTLTLEFSSKILGRNYPKLISKHTIEECLHNINKLNICTIDVLGVLSTAAVTRIDVTKDFAFELSEGVLNALNNNVSNYRRFQWSHYYKEGIVFSSDIKSSRDREEIIFYNKAKELEATAEKQRFLKSLSIEGQSEIKDYFKDKTRVEISLGSKKKIQEYLGIPNTYLSSVFDSSANPILHQFDKIFSTTKTEQTPKEIESYDDLGMVAIVKMFNGNLKLIEQSIRPLFAKKGGGKQRRLAKIKQVIQMLDHGTGHNTVQQVRELLLSI